MNSFYTNGNRILLAISIFLIAVNLFGQSYELDDIVVTAGRAPVSFSDLTRTVNIITKEEIKNTPVNSIPDLLQYVSGVDIKQQNPNGVQADVSIRGGSFEQTLVLVDGIKLSDPQTGHHNLSLPVSLDDIEKVEVLKGPGAQIFGANAFSGVINFITKKGNGTSISATVEGGENGLYNYHLSGSQNIAGINNRISFSKKKSDGYTHNTNFDVFNFSYRPTINLSNGVINLFAGYTNNKFGANGFYGNYPNQIEQVKTTLFSASAELGTSQFLIVPKAYWRNNDDEYEYDYINYPGMFINKHKTNSYGAELQASYKYKLGTLSVGGEFGKDKVESSNLGNHNREKYGFFAEQTFNSLDKFSASVGFFSYKYASIGWKFWPGVDLGYKLSSSTRLYASYGKAFRLPSYTDYYYSSPTSIGNPNLEHEEVSNYEAGIYYNKRAFDFNLSLFVKDVSNLIDYAKNQDDLKWYAQNITEITTRGLEVNFAFIPVVLKADCIFNKISLSYTYLDLEKKDTGFESRYVLENLKHQATLNILHKIPLDIMVNWGFKYQQRVNTDSYFITDLNISRQFDYVNVYVKATNLFNEYLANIYNFQGPGRWIITGAKFGI